MPNAQQSFRLNWATLGAGDISCYLRNISEFFIMMACAEQALSVLNGTPLGRQNVRLSCGRSPSSKQAQPDQSQWNGAYYGGYAQGYDAYGYAPPPQDPSIYYGGYPGYGNYQQPQQRCVADPGQ